MWVACELRDIPYFYRFTITEAKRLLNMLSDAVFDHHPAFVSSSYRAQKRVNFKNKGIKCRFKMFPCRLRPMLVVHSPAAADSLQLLKAHKNGLRIFLNVKSVI